MPYSVLDWREPAGSDTGNQQSQRLNLEIPLFVFTKIPLRERPEGYPYSGYGT
jgi:hypothetical protein